MFFKKRCVRHRATKAALLIVGVIFFAKNLRSLPTRSSFFSSSTNKNKAKPFSNNSITNTDDKDLDVEKFLYYNLSCSFEWSKYSCAHQKGNEEKGLAGRQFTSALLRDKALSTFKLFPREHSRLFMIGDSLTRQIFISLACLLEGIRGTSISEAKARWLPDWPCHGTSNCISGGPHSGFNVASLRFVNGAEIHFLPLGGSVGKGPFGRSKTTEANVVDVMISEIENKGFIEIHKRTALESAKPLRLSRNDTLLINIGIHNRVGDLTDKVRRLDLLGRKLHSPSNTSTTTEDMTASAFDRPSLWYMTTPTQHFESSDGQFGRQVARLKNRTCRSSLPVNPRSQIEMNELSNIDRIIEYDDLQLGSMHIGGKDCSHYCMPGPPDQVAEKLYRAWASQGTQTH